MSNIGFIGAGNMGFAMLKGLLKKTSLNNKIIFTSQTQETRKKVSKELNISFENSNIELAYKSKYIILAVKPNMYNNIIEEIKPALTEDKVVISIAPGITIDTLKEYVDNKCRVIRSMPNTPALALEGMSIITFSDDKFEDNEKQEILNIFKSFGEVEVLEEKFMDAVVPISGSSPAYVYMFIEAMADAGVLTGLPRKLSYKLAAQSVLGASKMVLETGSHPGELKDAVCSPGGTTIEAVHKLEKGNFRNTIIEAMISCYEKAKRMA